MKYAITYLFILAAATAAAQDTVKLARVHIIHGSRAKYQYKESEYKMLGGMFGGHVVTQLDSHVYGFLFSHYRFHLFPSKKRSIGKFEDVSAKAWRSSVTEDKVTSIDIPVTQQQFRYMDSAYREYSKASPYDYAFFGMRCAAVCYKVLADAGILDPVTDKQSMWKAFYPRPLRRMLVTLAKEKGWHMRITPGSIRRKWERDFK